MLKYALGANALFSASSGFLMLFAHGYFSSHIPLPAWAWMLIGVGLLIFAVDLAVLAYKPSWAGRLTPMVVLSDVAWVALTSVATLWFIDVLSIYGVLMILAVNFVVGSLAYFQSRGHKLLLAKA